MRPTKNEFQLFSAFDLVAQSQPGMRPEKDLLSTAKHCMSSLFIEDGASLEFVIHYLQNTDSQTKGMQDFQLALDRIPPDYNTAWDIFQSMHPNEVGATICLLLNLYEHDLR